MCDRLHSFVCSYTVKRADSDVLVQQNLGVNSSIFARDWIDYKNGFGELSSNYWLGLENLHLLTSTGKYRLEAVVQVHCTVCKLVCPSLNITS